MKPELCKVFNAAESRADGLAANEVAFIIKNAGDKRESVLSVINQAKASTPEGRDALRAVFEGDRSSIGGELRAQVDRISANREVRNLEKSLREKTGSYRFDSARGLLAQRAELINEMRDLAGDVSLSIPERRQRFHDIESQIHALVQDAREEMADGDRESETRAIASSNPLFGARRSPAEGSEWRSLLPSLSEYRALISEGVGSDGGYLVPDETSRKYVDALKVNSTFLRGLPAESIIPFTSDTLSVPQLVSSTGGAYVNEGQPIPEGQMVWGEIKFQTKKLGEVQWASTEVLEDSAVDLRRIIGDNLLRDTSLRFDADAFTGSGANPIKGILAQGTTTTLAAGKTTVTYDDVADGVSRIESMNGRPSVVWASTDAAASLRKEKASGSGVYQGGAPTDSPASTAWGLPVLVSGFLPAKTVVVADASRIVVGLRRNAQLKISEDARFDSDEVGFKLTMRVAGVSIAEAAAVQIVKAAAS